VAGGGLGRTPMLGVTVRNFLPEAELLGYLEAVMRVYNLSGRRDNKYKARIKILVHEMGLEAFRAAVEAEYARRPKPATDIGGSELARIAAYFAPPPFEKLPRWSPAYQAHRAKDAAFQRWARTNIAAHARDGYAIVNISLKPEGGIPGDATAGQMRAVADLAGRYSFDEVRVSHHQNLVLPHVRQDDLYDIWQRLTAEGLDAANLGQAGDIISCPGLDYCALATARSIPIAQAISRRFADLNRQADIGPLRINISGCINACGHHHVGHIGILGLEKKGVEFYQITIGGSSAGDSSIGTILGPGFSGDEVPDAVETIVNTYLALRLEGETFLAACRRAGPEPFREALYATRH